MRGSGVQFPPAAPPSKCPARRRGLRYDPRHGLCLGVGRIELSMRVLICGGGVIGASIAYFLSCRGVKATVIERSGIACAASGKSGGFLALDWCDGTPLEGLAGRSFALHASLADKVGREFGRCWGYRRMTTYAGSAAAQGHPRPAYSTHNLGWLSDSVRISRQLGSPDTTAQVHPGQFTTAMLQAAQ